MQWRQDRQLQNRTNLGNIRNEYLKKSKRKRKIYRARSQDIRQQYDIEATERMGEKTQTRME
jgi:hypothetical protein